MCCRLANCSDLINVANGNISLEKFLYSNLCASATIAQETIYNFSYYLINIFIVYELLLDYYIFTEIS